MNAEAVTPWIVLLTGMKAINPFMGRIPPILQGREARSKIPVDRRLLVVVLGFL